MEVVRLRKAAERGHFDHGWLDTHHTFSFAEYMDPRFMGFRTLRVINEDVVEAAAGFPTHSHRDMEIITYVLEGAVEHKDSMGNHGQVLPGDVQRMSAGTGVTHSEYNPLKDKPLHLLQIWILPEKKGMKPSYEQKSFSKSLEDGRLVLAASREGRDGSVTVGQDVDVWAARVKPGAQLSLPLEAGRHAWVQVAKGLISVNGQNLSTSDGLAVSEASKLELQAKSGAEFLIFNLP